MFSGYEFYFFFNIDVDKITLQYKGVNCKLSMLQVLLHEHCFMFYEINAKCS